MIWRTKSTNSMYKHRERWEYSSLKIVYVFHIKSVAEELVTVIGTIWSIQAICIQMLWECYNISTIIPYIIYICIATYEAIHLAGQPKHLTSSSSSSSFSFSCYCDAYALLITSFSGFSSNNRLETYKFRTASSMIQPTHIKHQTSKRVKCNSSNKHIWLDVFITMMEISRLSATLGSIYLLDCLSKSWTNFGGRLFAIKYKQIYNTWREIVV